MRPRQLSPQRRDNWFLRKYLKKTEATRRRLCSINCLTFVKRAGLSNKRSLFSIWILYFIVNNIIPLINQMQR